MFSRISLTGKSLAFGVLALFLAVAPCHAGDEADPATGAGETVLPASQPTAPAALPETWQQLIGKPAPDLDLQDALSGVQRLSDLRGKTVVLVFHSATCPPSRKAMLYFAELQKEMHGSFVLLIINVWDTAERSAQEINKLKLSVPVVVDNSAKTREAYYLDAIPLTVIIAPDGKVTYAVLGYGEETAGVDLAKRIEEASGK